MIRHVVFFTVKDTNDLETVYDGLSILRGIGEFSHFEVGRNLRTDTISPEGPDFVVYAEFDDADQMARFKGHPLYQESINRVRPLRDQRIAADFLAA